jgi:LuxR family transcriptional regulator, maltose regulon positive regulatory protein
MAAFPPDTGTSASGERRGRVGKPQNRPRSIRLIESKLGVPELRHLYIERPSVSALLDAYSDCSLTIVAAPTGYGKTTALSLWARASEASTAWIALDAGDNDPVHYLLYLVTALSRVAPLKNAHLAVRALGRPESDPLETALPYLLNAMQELERPIAVVLDDYQRIESPSCHQVTSTLVDHAPAGLRFIVSTRLDPPLSRGLLRARGELGEVRATELGFTDEEADQLLNGALELGLDRDLVDQLNRRTEGWPAGLYLAALSLAGIDDRRAFVESFAGSNRHVVEYLATEVLDAQPDDVQQFLLQTSILDRMSAPLCDAVCLSTDSSKQLDLLMTTNLFLTRLDAASEWYRYHRLFLELLRSELIRRSPELIATLHHRAATWHEAYGELEEAVHHAVMAGDSELATKALSTRWRRLYQFGQHASLRRLLGRLPEPVIDRSAPLSFIAALLAGALGAPRETFDGHLRNVEESGWDSTFPDGTPSIDVAVTFARMVYPYGDIQRSWEAADLLRGLVPTDSILGPAARVGQARADYLLGEHDAVRQVLPALGRETAATNPQVSAMTPALRALLELEDGDAERALELAREAAEVADEVGVAEVGTVGIVWIALGAALAANGRPAEAETALERAANVTSNPADSIVSGHALLWLARVRATRGRAAEARKLLVRVRAIVDEAAAPGVLAAQLDELDRRLSTRARRDISYDDLPTESELRVLRLMASSVTRSEIAAQLFLSPNTVKSHQRALYRKLGANSRDTAVARARELGLL